jgi:signal transduction histidine kinase
MTTASAPRLTISDMTKRVPLSDAVIAVGLSAYGVILVCGAVANNTKHSGVFASVMVLFMTLPVAWRRCAPLAVAAVLAGGAVLNVALVGDMIRCGPALPALLLCAYSVGRRPLRLRNGSAPLALACLLFSAVLQCATDPNLQLDVMVALAPMIVGLYAAGRLVDARTHLAADLEQRNAELRHQRQRRAAVAVEADRARIAEGLEAELNAQISEMGAAAANGRRALALERSPEAAQVAFGTIQQRGRETLAHMRQMVGTLLEPGSPEPQPSLSQLDRLLERAGSADLHLHVTGAPRVLPPGVELAGYRTLEHLLNAYGDVPGARIDVEVDFAAEALELTVRGPVPDPLGLRTAVAAAQARLEVHHGSLSSSCPAGRWEATALIPL